MRFAIALIFIAVLAGCASSGHKITPEKIQQIRVGQSDAAQMQKVFGPPVSQSYGSEGKLSANWMYVHAGPFGTGMKQQILSVLFDESGKVEKYTVMDGTPGGVRLGN